MGAGEALVEDALEARVLLLYQHQGIVNALADVGLLGAGTQCLPAGALGHPEHVDLAIVVALLQLLGQKLGVCVVEVVVVTLVGEAALKLAPARLEGVGDVLDEDETQHDVLVLGGVHIGAQLVGRGPEGALDAVDAALDRDGLLGLFGRLALGCRFGRWSRTICA